jgi:uncharacterized repeat protein (TIGR03803 family)
MRPFLHGLTITTALLVAQFPQFCHAQALIFGTGELGGSADSGVLYSIRADGSHYQLLHQFTGHPDGASPFGSVIRFGTKLYGVTTYGGVIGAGSLYSYDPRHNSYQKLQDFTGPKGVYPMANLFLYQGKIYGMTTGGGANKVGTVFTFDPSADSLTDVFDFPSVRASGPYPYLSVFATPAILNNKFYFTTTYGGVNDAGMIEVYDPVANTVTDLYDLSAYANPYANMVIIDSVLYGADNDQLFSFNPVGNVYNVVYSGVYTFGMTAWRGKIYAANYADYYKGNLWSFDPATGQYTNLHSFDSIPNDGYASEAYPLIFPNGRMIANCTAGGTYSWGTLFSYNIPTGGYATIFNFNGTDGGEPTGPLFALVPTAADSAGGDSSLLSVMADDHPVADSVSTSNNSSGLKLWISGPNTLEVAVFSSDAKQLALRLFNTAGQTMLTSSLSVQPGENDFSIQTNILQPGIYVVKIYGPGLSTVRQMWIGN